MPFVHEIAGDRASYIAAGRERWAEFEDDDIAEIDLFFEPLRATEYPGLCEMRVQRAVGVEATYLRLVSSHPGLVEVQAVVGNGRAALNVRRSDTDGMWDRFAAITDAANFRATLQAIMARPVTHAETMGSSAR